MNSVYSVWGYICNVMRLYLYTALMYRLAGKGVMNIHLEGDSNVEREFIPQRLKLLQILSEYTSQENYLFRLFLSCLQKIFPKVAVYFCRYIGAGHSLSLIDFPGSISVGGI